MSSDGRVHPQVLLKLNMELGWDSTTIKVANGRMLKTIMN